MSKNPHAASLPSESRVSPLRLAFPPPPPKRLPVTPRTRRIRALLLLSLLILAAFDANTAWADRWVWDQSPNPAAPFQSGWRSAARTISEGLAAAGPGEKIWVAGGPYGEGPLTLQAGQTIYGMNALLVGYDEWFNPIIIQWETTDAVTIQGNGTGPIFACNGGASFRNLILAGNQIPGRGGGIRATGGSVLVTGCRFTGLVASRGGAISGEGTNLALADCRFYSNKARSGDGGAICLTNGGSLTIPASVSIPPPPKGPPPPTLLTCTFTGNKANQNGGAIFKKDGVVTISSCFFTDANEAKDDGGGACLLNIGSGTISATFTGNQALGGQGGGLFLGANCTNVTVSSSPFNDNRSPKKAGGGMCVEECTHITIGPDCAFSANISPVGGGLVVSRSDDVTVKHSSFVQHANSSFGAGAAVTRCQGPGVTFSNECVFRENTATQDGGAIWVSDKSVVTIDVVRFIKNIAGGSGGGIRAQEKSTLEVTTGHFEENKAQKTGGAISLVIASSVIRHSTFLTNQALLAAGENDDVPGNGGGIACENCKSVKIVEETTFKDNLANHVGGGVWAFHSTILLDAARFAIGNNAIDFGGGISVREDSKATVKKTRIAFSDAKTCDGGGIDCQGSSVVIFDGSDGEGAMVGCTAERHGGGAYVGNSILAFNNTVKILGNEAKQGGGGGVMVEGSNKKKPDPLEVIALKVLFPSKAEDLTANALQAMILSSAVSTFTGNKSHLSGAGIRVSGKEKPAGFDLDHANFDSNRSADSSDINSQFAAIAVSPGLAKLGRCNFFGTGAPQEAAIHINNSKKPGKPVRCDHVTIANSYRGINGQNANLLATDCTITGAFAGVFLKDSDADIDFCLIQFSIGTDVLLFSKSTAQIDETDFAGSAGTVGLFVGDGSQAYVRHSAFHGHMSPGGGGYAVLKVPDVTPPVDAGAGPTPFTKPGVAPLGNWWAPTVVPPPPLTAATVHILGPTNPTTNPTGTGEKISNNVLFGGALGAFPTGIGPRP